MSIFAPADPIAPAPGGSPPGSRRSRARRAAARRRVPSASRTTASSRTWASADEPLVAGVARRDAVVEQHVLGRVEAGDLEVPQPPQVEPPRDHRVHAPDEGVLHDAAGRVVVLGPERRVGRHGRPGRPPPTAPPDDDAADARESVLRQRRCDARRDGVGRRPGRRASAGRGRPPTRCSAGRSRAGRADRAVEAAVGELGHLADGGDEQRRPAVEHVVGDDDGRPSGMPCARRTAASCRARARGSGGGPAPRASARGAGCPAPAARRGTRRSARGWRPARRSARPVGLVVGSPPAPPARTDLRPSPGRGRRRRRAGRTSGTGRCAPGRRPPGAAAGWPRRAGRARRGASSASGPCGAGVRSHSCSTALTTGDVRGLLLVGQEQPVHRLLEDGRALEVGDAVVRQRTGQLVLEHRRQLLAVDVEALQVGVEVLARAVHALVGAVVLVLGTVAGQLGDVGERRAARRARRPGPCRPGGRRCRRAAPRRRGVASPGGRSKPSSMPCRSRSERRAPVGGVGVAGHGQLDGGARVGGDRRAVVVTDRLEPQQRRAGLDLATGA